MSPYIAISIWEYIKDDQLETFVDYEYTKDDVAKNLIKIIDTLHTVSNSRVELITLNAC